MTDQVESSPFRGQHQCRRCRDPGDNRTRPNRIAVGDQIVEGARRVTTHHFNHRSGHGKAGDDASVASPEGHDAPLVGRDRGGRRDVEPVSEILDKGDSDQLLNCLGVEASRSKPSDGIGGERMKNDHTATLARSRGGVATRVLDHLRRGPDRVHDPYPTSPPAQGVAYGSTMANSPADAVSELRDRLGRGVRALLAGDPEPRALPPLDDDRRFPPTSAMWAVHSDAAMLVGGLRALLLQTLHPPTLAGVTQHSTYRTDPLGRLQRTGSFVGTTTFGSRAEADQAVAAVRAVHEHIVGTTTTGTPYAATDPHLLAWVHCTEADSFLRARMRYGAEPLAPGVADRYVGEIGEIGAELGVIDPPQSRQELRVRLQSYRLELATSADTHETVRFLTFPPLSLGARGPYGVVFAAAASMLPGFARRQLRLPLLPLAEPFAIRPAATLLLRTIGWALGEHPARAAAQDA